MMNRIKIGVAITTYNGAKFIEDQLDSILTQTVIPDEVIISDDGSTDDTVAIVKKYIECHGFNETWKLHINEKNKGYAKNFLDTALMIKGEIVFFCDQDDIWTEDRLEKMTSIMEQNQDINLLCTNLEPFYYEDDTRKWSKKDLADMTNDGSVEYRSMDSRYFHLKRSGCTMCLRRTFLNEVMPYWIPGWAHDDFVWKMAAVSDSCAVYQYTSLKRRMHSSNATVVRLRTRQWRINQLYNYGNQYQLLFKYAKHIDADHIKLRTIKKNIDSIEWRKKVVEKRHLFDWFVLYFKYKDCYPRIKGLYLDIYIAIMNQYKGAN